MMQQELMNLLLNNDTIFRPQIQIRHASSHKDSECISHHILDRQTNKNIGSEINVCLREKYSIIFMRGHHTYRVTEVICLSKQDQTIFNLKLLVQQDHRKQLSNEIGCYIQYSHLQARNNKTIFEIYDSLIQKFGIN
ncbi:unnamed protein product (macronuclear) [Paramecium tetraurelia]|uniref:Uncharacterized protein n=1 Tax=Paramecium tetraurelia TaxID=5888 RepID=A0D8Z9_PARTE|nr:uncharacterized protein GSPATT00014462001 [Paramecium tetraurelia]CAK79516.1 unnamed protein product [Paramecium tetraurelia]|eukprot:XP_001446913.1 hypothetical protein (macronuclear) [Paramecium tetraurelia strain d4-2]